MSQFGTPWSLRQAYWYHFQDAITELLAPWLLMTLIAPPVALAGIYMFSSVSNVPVLLIICTVYTGWSLVFVMASAVLAARETYCYFADEKEKQVHA